MKYFACAKLLNMLYLNHKLHIRHQMYYFDVYKVDFMLKRIIIAVVSFLLFMQFVYAENTNEKISSSDIYSQNVSSIVYVATQNSTGSGVILKEDGTFVTCFHVIANADYILVKLEDGSIYYVNGFRYLNPLSDVAILTLDANRKFEHITLNPSKNLKVGEKIYAISNPQGLQFVFSDGMINQYTKDYIQFSAPVSSGSSGGALLNDQGYLIGIITSQLDLNRSQNINFALPNEYFISKIYNKAIINSNKLNWTDFVSLNASNDEFSMISEYAISKNNFSMYYKYLRAAFLLHKNKLPVKLYPVLGYLALVAAYDNDAITWYKLSYANNYNKPISALGIFIAYCLLGEPDKQEVDFWAKELSLYKKVITDLQVLDNNYYACQKLYPDNNYCNDEYVGQLFDYIYKNTNFNWK